MQRDVIYGAQAEGRERAMAGSMLCTVSSIALGIAGGVINILRIGTKDDACNSQQFSMPFLMQIQVLGRAQCKRTVVVL